MMVDVINFLISASSKLKMKTALVKATHLRKSLISTFPESEKELLVPPHEEEEQKQPEEVHFLELDPFSAPFFFTVEPGCIPQSPV